MYVDALFSKSENKIYVVERANGLRIYKDYLANYAFYYNDNKGKYRTIYGNSVSKFKTNNYKEFQKELRIHSNKVIWESDLNWTFECLAENYRHLPSPTVNIGFFDIEVDSDPKSGFSSPEDAYMPITAISIYLNWLDKIVTLALPPKTITFEQGQKIANQFEDTFVFDNEVDLLNTFLSLIDDCDILSGWNSEGYDIPYTVNRICKILSKNDTSRLCLWNQFPKKFTYTRYGVEKESYDLIGRVHLDYMALYRKFSAGEHHSYSLDSISKEEVHESKTEYNGTLTQLYNNDFKKFIEYNRQDVSLLNKLDKKLHYIELANNLAHTNTVLLPTVKGTVMQTEQAVINQCHDNNLVVPNRKYEPKEVEVDDEDEDGVEKHDGVAGAYVAYPKKGLHKYVGVTDINSLYPSDFRMLNMSPETIVGQIRPDMTDAFIKQKMKEGSTFANAWEGQFGSIEYQAVLKQDIGTIIIVDWENGKSDEMSAAQLYNMIWSQNKPFILSANGTIFSTEHEGIIPGLFRKWYSNRKEFQKYKSNFIDLQYGIKIPEDLLNKIV
jgi:DNA polymerase elongation subunit (family B)